VSVALSLHGRLAVALVLYLTLVGLWGLLLGARALGPSASFRGALAIAEIGALAQGVLGFAVLALGSAPDGIHVLYGFALALTIPLAASLVRERAPRGQSLALGFAALFAAGLAIRGITTA
jgi:hypothetical protein